MSAHSVIAPAKLNLFLHITGKRSDGYHLLDSLVVFTGFGDVLDFAPADSITLAVDGPYAAGLKNDDSNIVMKAARLLQARAGIHKGAKITLHKHIPVAGGLGGGSADAAAALRGLMALWQLRLDKKELLALALQLGSDVPVCMASHPAWMRGVGDEITPVALPHAGWLVLVNPGKPLMTRDVFACYNAPYTAPADAPAEIGSLGEWLDILLPLHNALETPAVALQPAIGDVLAAVKATRGCLLSRMSGSGATCFGLYATSLLAEQAAVSLRRQNPAWWVQHSALYNERKAAA